MSLPQLSWCQQAPRTSCMHAVLQKFPTRSCGAGTLIRLAVSVVQARAAQAAGRDLDMDDAAEQLGGGGRKQQRKRQRADDFGEDDEDGLALGGQADGDDMDDGFYEQAAAAAASKKAARKQKCALR